MATDPICGMSVDERTATLRAVRDNRTYYFCSGGCLRAFEDPEHELADLRRRLAFGVVASVSVVALTYLTHPPGSPYVSWAFATAAQVYLGLPFYRGTVDAIRGRVANMDVLIAVGTTAAYAYSTVVLLAPGHLPPTTYFDASVLILTILLAGNYLERLTRNAARSSVRALGRLIPSVVHRLDGEAEHELPTSELKPGDLFRVRPGERVAADGIVRTGRSSLDESLLTGESRPVRAGPGARVVGGSINLDGVLDVEATSVGEEGWLGRLGELLSEAELGRVPLQRLADRIAAGFVPLVLGLAIAAAVFWGLVGAGPGVVVLVFVSVVITACPCAFGLATPAALLVGSERAAREGVLFKGADAIERAARVDTVVFDKTGTLTEGRPRLEGIAAAPGQTPEAVVALAAGLELGSNHPFATAVRDRAQANGIAPDSVASLQVEPGQGVSGTVDGRPARVVRSDEPAGLGPALSSSLATFRSKGYSVSTVLRSAEPIGLLAFDDPVRPEAAEAAATLRAEGFALSLVTGDQREAAERVAATVGIDRVVAGATPEGKIEFVRHAQSAGHRVAFVGDGINDAPVLAAADLGIALGSGTEIARESGQVLLARPDLRSVELSLRVARATVSKVRGNLRWAVGYNLVLLPIAAGALVPVLGLGIFGVLPIAGAVAMALSSTLVLANSLELRRLRAPGTPAAAPAAVPAGPTVN